FNDDLQNLLSSVNIPIIMLGHDLNIRRFTPSAARVFNIINTDIGRPIGDLKPKITVANLDQAITEVIESLKVLEKEVQDQDGHWYYLTVRPYKTQDKKIEGAVIAAIDIDTLKRSQREIQEARAFAETVIDTMRESLLVLDGDLRVKRGNRS